MKLKRLKKEKRSMSNYPCKICVVRGCCTQYCDLIVTDEKVIAMFLLVYKTCPDCGCEELMFPLKFSAGEPSIIICSDCRKVFTSDYPHFQMKRDKNIFSIDELKNQKMPPEFVRVFSIRGERIHETIEKSIKKRLSLTPAQEEIKDMAYEFFRPKITKKTKIWGQKPLPSWGGLFIKGKNGKWSNILSEDVQTQCAIIK